MATTVLFEEQVEIPLNLRSLAAFRRWATSDEFPERGRIDYVAGRIEVDTSPEDFFCHGTLKTEIVEIVSDHSVQKDRQRLPEAYFRAGVAEFWLADARGQTLVFRIHRRGESGFETVKPDSEGFRPSAVLACSYRLEGRRDTQGNWTFDLIEKHAPPHRTP
jgi:hypothetical protein